MNIRAVDKDERKLRDLMVEPAVSVEQLQQVHKMRLKARHRGEDIRESQYYGQKDSIFVVSETGRDST